MPRGPSRGATVGVAGRGPEGLWPRRVPPARCFELRGRRPGVQRRLPADQLPDRASHAHLTGSLGRPVTTGDATALAHPPSRGARSAGHRPPPANPAIRLRDPTRRSRAGPSGQPAPGGNGSPPHHMDRSEFPPRHDAPRAPLDPPRRLGANGVPLPPLVDPTGPVPRATLIVDKSGPALAPALLIDATGPAPAPTTLINSTGPALTSATLIGTAGPALTSTALIGRAGTSTRSTLLVGTDGPALRSTLPIETAGPRSRLPSSTWRDWRPAPPCSSARRDRVGTRPAVPRRAWLLPAPPSVSARPERPLARTAALFLERGPASGRDLPAPSWLRLAGRDERVRGVAGGSSSPAARRDRAVGRSASVPRDGRARAGCWPPACRGGPERAGRDRSPPVEGRDGPAGVMAAPGGRTARHLRGGSP